NPKLLIADEPTTALDVTIQAQILRVIADLQRELALSVLLITHDLGVVAGVADRVAVMYAGNVVELCPTRPLFRAPSHPYTRGLLDATPNPAMRVDRLLAIPGSPPAPCRSTTCAFAPRCPRRTPACDVRP